MKTLFDVNHTSGASWESWTFEEIPVLIVYLLACFYWLKSEPSK